jgi:hypothetical protein
VLDVVAQVRKMLQQSGVQIPAWENGFPEVKF